MKLSAEFRCNFGWKKQTTSAIKSWLELKENLSTTVKEKELKNAYMAFYTQSLDLLFEKVMAFAP